MNTNEKPKIGLAIRPLASEPTGTIWLESSHEGLDG